MFGCKLPFYTGRPFFHAFPPPAEENEPWEIIKKISTAETDLDRGLPFINGQVEDDQSARIQFQLHLMIVATSCMSWRWIRSLPSIPAEVLIWWWYQPIGIVTRVEFNSEHFTEWTIDMFRVDIFKQKRWCCKTNILTRQAKLRFQDHRPYNQKTMW